MKIKFHLDDESALNKAIEIPIMIVVVRVISLENHKYYLQVSFDKYLYEL